MPDPLTGLPSASSNQPLSDLLATVERARVVVKLLKERRTELVNAYGKTEGRRARRRLFEQGWHFLPEVYPSQTDDLRLLTRQVKGETGDLVGVCMMGRKVFRKVRRLVNSLRNHEIPMGVEKVLMYGPKGTGKTHLFIQLVVHLTEHLKAEGKGMRVAPIFDCAKLRRRGASVGVQARFGVGLLGLRGEANRDCRAVRHESRARFSVGNTSGRQSALCS